MAAKKKNQKNGVTKVKLSEMQQELLQDANQGVQMAMAQQNLTLATVLAGHDVKFEDVQQTLKLSEDGTALEYGGAPEA